MVKTSVPQIPDVSTDCTINLSLLSTLDSMLHGMCTCVGDIHEFSDNVPEIARRDNPANR